MAMYQNFTHKLVALLALVVFGGVVCAQTNKVTGFIPKKNGGTKRVVAKHAKKIVLHKGGRIFSRNGDALFLKEFYYKIKFKPHLFKHPFEISESELQNNYFNAIIGYASKRQKKYDVKEVVGFATAFSKTVAAQFDTWVSIDTMQLGDGRVAYLKKDIGNGAYKIGVLDNKNNYDLITVHGKDTTALKDFPLLQQDTAYTSSASLVGVLRVINDFKVVNEFPVIHISVSTNGKKTDTTYIFKISNSTPIVLSEKLAKYLIDKKVFKDSNYAINKNALYNLPKIAVKPATVDTPK